MDLFKIGDPVYYDRFPGTEPPLECVVIGYEEYFEHVYIWVKGDSEFPYRCPMRKLTPRDLEVKSESENK